MTPFTVLKGGCVVIPVDNIDTDQVIPARFMNTVRSAGYGGYLFYDLRYEATGEHITEFALNKTEGSEVILVVGNNFGCGSSREAAVYALLDYGFRAVVARSFGDIFRTNAGKNGRLTVALADDAYNRFVRHLSWVPSDLVKIDLAAQVVELTTGKPLVFEIDPATKRKMLLGIDDLVETLQYESMIKAFELQYFQDKRWLVPG